MAAKKKTSTRASVIRLTLTKEELTHLRDLMSVVLPPDGERTLSKALSALKKNQVKEGILWKKVVDLCLSNGISVGTDAPDFIVDLSVSPTLDVFPSSSEDE